MSKKILSIDYLLILITAIIVTTTIVGVMGGGPQYATNQDNPEIDYLPDFNIPKDLSFQSQAAVLYDLDHSVIVASKEAELSLAPASLTKLFTTFIAAKTLLPEQMITIKNDYSNLPENKIGLVLGDEISASDLIKSSLISSANDSAQQLASIIDINVINQTILDLGLKSHFMNGSGLDADSHFSSAKDIAILAGAIFNEDKIINIMNKKSDSIKINNKIININHTHHMIGSSNSQHWTVLAGKTGTTANAGESLLTIAKVRQGQQWHNVAIVLLNSPDRYGETENILNKIST